MAQNSSSKKSEGLCERIHNAVSPFRPRIRRISDQPRGSISVTGDRNSVKNTSPQAKLHQSKTIPVEFRHSASKKESDEREIVIVRGQKFAKSASGKEEIVRAEQLPPPPPHHVHFAKARSKKDEDSHSVHDGKFSDYISKFKNKMIKTASHAGSGGGVGGGVDCGGGVDGGGGGGGGGNSTRRDSFNDKVTNYIDRAKIKIRTTTNVGQNDN